MTPPPLRAHNEGVVDEGGASCVPLQGYLAHKKTPTPGALRAHKEGVVGAGQRARVGTEVHPFLAPCHLRVVHLGRSTCHTISGRGG